MLEDPHAHAQKQPDQPGGRAPPVRARAKLLAVVGGPLVQPDWRGEPVNALTAEEAQGAGHPDVITMRGKSRRQMSIVIIMCAYMRGPHRVGGRGSNTLVIIMCIYAGV